MFLPPHGGAKRHHTALPWTESPGLAQWMRVNASGRGTLIRDLLMATLLCATRIGEFGRMDAGDIDLAKKVIYVRNRKDGKSEPFVVPYPRQAEPYLFDVYGIAGRGDHDRVLRSDGDFLCIRLNISFETEAR